MFSRQTPKGRWRFVESYSDPLTGRKKEVSVTLDKNTTASRKEAAVILQKKIEDATYMHKTTDFTLEQLTKMFVEHQYAMHKESTALQDDMTLRPIVKLIGPDARVSKIQAGDIVRALERSGKSNTWKNIKIKHLRVLWRWAYRQGYVPDTKVVDRLEKYPEESARQKVIGKYMESEELREVISDMSGNTDYQLLTRFLALSGCRIGEVIAMTVKDVNMGDKEITVNKTYALNTKKVQSTKTETSERTVYMRPELLELVRTVLHRQKQICLAYGVRTPLLFPWTDGGYLHYEAYAKYFREHTKKVLGHSLPVHSLRHTFTSLMAEAEVPIETISRQLGHADSKVTRDIYLHVTDKIRKADNAKLDAVKIL